MEDKKETFPFSHPFRVPFSSLPPSPLLSLFRVRKKKRYFLPPLVPPFLPPLLFSLLFDSEREGIENQSLLSPLSFPFPSEVLPFFLPRFMRFKLGTSVALHPPPPSVDVIFFPSFLLQGVSKGRRTRWCFVSSPSFRSFPLFFFLPPLPRG